MRNKTVLIVAFVIALAVGCAVVRKVEDPPGSGNYKQVAETDPRFNTGLDTVKSVSDAVGPINPWHGLVTILIAGAAGVAEWNKRRKQAQLDAVVAGVEAKGGTEVKEAIKAAAMAKGVETELNKTVTRVTGG